MAILNKNNIDELIDYLETKGSNHKMYYHYTNLDSAINILRSGYWHLSLGDVMNDKHELTKGTEEKWKRTYISSFAYGSGENMAMWGLYGIPWEGAVRIGIPGRHMKNWINSIEKVYKVSPKSTGFNYTKEIKVSPILTDVAYVSGKSDEKNYKIANGRDIVKLPVGMSYNSINNDTKITGFIKNAAWSYENEVRIKVSLNRPIEIKRVAVKISEEVLNSLELTTGPWSKNNFQEIISQELEKKNCLINFSNYENSIFKDKVELRSICSFCKSTYIAKQQYSEEAKENL